MAAEIYIRTAWKLVHEDFKKIYELATPLLSKPCLNILNALQFAFIFGELVLFTIAVLFAIRTIVGRMGMPVRKTMHAIYSTMVFVAFFQIICARFWIFMEFQSILVFLFVATIGNYILDP